MKIKDYIRQVFTKKVKNKNNYDLARFSDILPMPKRDDFLNQKIMLDLIDSYKKNYEQILLIPQYYIGKYLHAFNLYEEMKMNLDLIVFNFFKNDENISRNPISNLILSEKFKLYYENIIIMKSETEARIIALNEIINEKIFLAKNKKNSILNEIERLYMTLILFASQKQVLMAKIELCINNVIVEETKNLLKDENNQLIMDKLITLKKSSLTEYKKVLPKFYPIRDDNLLKDLAFIERELEIYTYKNKGKINTYLDDIRRITSTTLNANNREELLKELEDIELNFLVFQEYGKNLLTEDNLEKLYRIKFQVLTYSPNGICESLENYKMHDSELEYYKERISQIIAFFISGNNMKINNFFKEDSIMAIEEISQLIKTNNIYDSEEILIDKLKLNLVLALDNKDGFKNFYLNYPFSKNDIEKICPDLSKVIKDGEWKNLFVLNENPSIELYMWLYHLEKQNLGMNFFTLLKKHIDLEENNKYYIPEGIKEIKISSCYGSDYLLNLKKEMEGKIVIMPESLISLNGRLFTNVSLEGLYLNEGLKYLGYKALTCKEIKTLIIPSTIESFSSSSFDYAKIKTCIFNDFQNSKILNNSLLLNLFLEKFIYLIKVYTYPPESCYLKNEQYSDLINKDYVNNVKTSAFKIKLKIDRIIFVDGENKHPINNEYLERYIYYKNNEDIIFYKQEKLNPMPYDVEIVAQRINELLQSYKNDNQKLIKKNTHLQ